MFFKNIHIVSTAFILLVFISGGYAQDLKSDIIQMNTYYKITDKIGLETKVNIYNSAGGKVSTQRMELKRNGNNFVYKVDNTEMLVTKDYVIMVNNLEKNIMVRGIDPKEWEIIHNTTYKVNMDSVIEKYDSVKFERTEENLKHYTIYSSKKLIKKTDLWLDGETGRISKMVYLYNQKLYKEIGKVEIFFMVLPNDFLNDKKLFQEARIIVRQGNDYKTAQEYSKYKLNIVNNEN